jgi:hypothetical protein
MYNWYLITKNKNTTIINPIYSLSISGTMLVCYHTCFKCRNISFEVDQIDQMPTVISCTSDDRAEKCSTSLFVQHQKSWSKALMIINDSSDRLPDLTRKH